MANGGDDLSSRLSRTSTELKYASYDFLSSTHPRPETKEPLLTTKIPAGLELRAETLRELRPKTYCAAPANTALRVFYRRC